MPRLQDLFQTYLREMRPGGAARLRRHLSTARGTDRARQPRRRAGARHRRAVHPDADPMSDNGSRADRRGTRRRLGRAKPRPRPRRTARSASRPRVLNQAEIDSLLGFDDGPAGGENRTGMQKIISSGLVSYERLPMLEIVFDRLVRIMSTIAAQLHLRQCRGRHRQHPVAALRRLPELDPAAGDAGGVQGRGVGQLRPDGGRLRA